MAKLTNLTVSVSILQNISADVDLFINLKSATGSSTYMYTNVIKLPFTLASF